MARTKGESSPHAIGGARVSEKLEDFEDVSVYTIDAARRQTLLSAGRECSIVWSTEEAWPVGVTHLYFWENERFWVTCTRQRKRVAALRTRPQSCVIVSFDDEQTITAKTLATVHDPGSRHESWLFPKLAERVMPEQPALVRQAGLDGFVDRLRSDHRVIIEFEPVKWITFDGRRVKAHAAGLWHPGQPWREPDA